MSHEDIIWLIEAMALHMHRSPHTVGRLASGSGDFYARLKRGHDLTMRRAAIVAQYLSDHWPANTEWPTDIPRPPVIPPEPEKAPAGDEAAPAGADGQVEEPVA